MIPLVTGDRQIIEAGGISLEVTIRGDGPTLLYLHAGDSVDPAAPFVGALARRFRVVAPSHPGFGRSALPRDFSTADDLAYFYLDLMAAWDLRDVLLAGSSFGGWLAAEIAIKSQERIKALVLAGALGAKFQAPAVPEIADLFFAAFREVRALLYADGDPDRRDYSQLPEEAVSRMVRDREALTLFGWSPLLHDPKLRQRLHRIDVPALVLWGDGDRTVAPSYGRAYAAAIPGARFELVPGAGHYLHDERPAEFAAAIAAFADALPDRHPDRKER